jgi:hypothetical protein
MTKYRVYCLDGMSRIGSVEVIEAVNDAEAVIEAEALNKGLSREVWDRERLVARIAPRPA